MQYFYDLVIMLLGTYSPLETTIHVPLESVDPVTGAVYISGYQSYDVVADGLASLDVTYLLAFLMCLFMLKVIYGVIANTLNYFVINKGVRRIL